MVIIGTEGKAEKGGETAYQGREGKEIESRSTT